MELLSVYYKNFQSVGNSGIKIDLNRSPTTLIGGDNGSGKSTLLEAICYGLFGKTLKKVKLSGLINSKNKRGMVVEINFRVNGDDYKVVRSQKPNKFEIYVNGADEPLMQNAAKKDYQARLERIIGFDYKLFTQVVLLNRERYKPFMELDTAERRKVVEDILDIGVFSVMNKLNKDDLRDLKMKSNDLEYKLDNLKSKCESAQKIIDQQESNKKERIDEAKLRISEAEGQLSYALEEFDNFTPIEFDDSAISPIEKKCREIRDIQSKLSTKKSLSRKEIDFLSENDICPTCDQHIDEDFRETRVSKLQSEIDKFSDAKTQLDEKLGALDEELEVLREEKARYRDDQQKKKTLHSNVSRCGAELKKANSLYESLIEKLNEKEDLPDIDGLKEKRDDVAAQLEKTLNEIEECQVVSNILRDDAVKADIVNDYIGYINKRMNEFMNDMGFFINITLDGNFNETVNSISRENFTYDSLSTGQKTRLNLAIWLTLLEVSSMKNSAVVNILFLDEILENLDQDGVSLFMKLVNDKLSHKNVFVVTQRFEEFKDNFRSELVFEQDEQDFTKIV